MNEYANRMNVMDARVPSDNFDSSYLRFKDVPKIDTRQGYSSSPHQSIDPHPHLPYFSSFIGTLCIVVLGLMYTDFSVLFDMGGGKNGY